MLAEWGPIGNALVFVQDNNIFYKANVSSNPAQLTTDGRENIYNGVCDWVYEEEVFSTNTALWFSPNGAQLAYIRFDDTLVQTMKIPIYGPAGAFQYPEEILIPYPKTGTPNPTVQLFSIDLKTLVNENQVERHEIRSPISSEHIIANVAWADNETLLATWMNRVQNETYLQTCVDDKCKILKSWVSATGWIDTFKVIFNADGTRFLFINATKQPNNESYAHLTMVSMENGESTALTTGNFAVLERLHWDMKKNRIFYMATRENEPYTQHLFAVSTDEDIQNRTSTCLTCNIKRNGVLQTYFSATFSPGGEYIMLLNDGPSVPRVDIVSVKPSDPIELENLFDWEENKALNALLKTRSSPIIQQHTIRLSSGFDAIVKLQMPPNVDLSGGRKYPMLVNVYAGPGSYIGSDRFDISMATYLCTNRSYILAEINGRGSGQRSEELMHQIYRSMGTVEIQDQIETAE